MNREFIAAVIGRALHEEIFLQLWQNDATAAADAMERTYDQDDLRDMQAIHDEIAGMSSVEARDYLMETSQQIQNVFGGPQRPAA